MDFTLFNTLLSTVVTTGASLRGMLVGYGLPILGALFTTVLVWTLVKHMLGEGFAETVVSAVQTAFMAGFVAVLLMAWTTRLPGTNFSVADFFVGGMNEIAMSVQGSNNMTATMNKTLKSVMGMGSTAAEICVTEDVANDPNGSLQPGGTQIICQPDPSATTAQPLWSFKSMLNLGDFIIAIVMRLAAVIALVLTVALYQCVLILSIILVDIGLILGPVLVPWLIWRPSAFLFDGFIKVMISGGLYKVVASVILVYVSALFKAYETIDVTPLQESEFASPQQTTIAVQVLMVSLTGLYLMMQVQSIVGMIVGGGGIDLSPRPGRAITSIVRMGKSAVGAMGGGSKVPPASPTSPPATPQATYNRIGAAPGGGAGGGVGRSSPAAVRARSDRANGAFGRGGRR